MAVSPFVLGGSGAAAPDGGERDLSRRAWPSHCRVAIASLAGRCLDTAELVDTIPRAMAHVHCERLGDAAGVAAGAFRLAGSGCRTASAARGIPLVAGSKSGRLTDDTLCEASAVAAGFGLSGAG